MAPEDSKVAAVNCKMHCVLDVSWCHVASTKESRECARLRPDLDPRAVELYAGCWRWYENLTSRIRRFAHFCPGGYDIGCSQAIDTSIFHPDELRGMLH